MPADNDFDLIYTCEKSQFSIFIGNISIGRDVDRLIHELLVTAVFDVSNTKMKDKSQKEFVGLTREVLNLNDSEDDDPKFTREIEPYIEKIKHHLSKGNILVHCRHGRIRSASVIAAFLVRYHQIHADDAVQLIRQRRQNCFSKGRNPFHKSLFLLQQRYQNNDKQSDNTPNKSTTRKRTATVIYSPQLQQKQQSTKRKRRTN